MGERVGGGGKEKVTGKFKEVVDVVTQCIYFTSMKFRGRLLCGEMVLRCQGSSKPLPPCCGVRPGPGPPCRFWRVWYRDDDAAEVQCRHFFSTSTQPSGLFSAGLPFWDASRFSIPSDSIPSPPCRRTERPRSATPPAMEANAVVVPVTLPPTNFPRDGHNAQALGRGLNALVKQVCPSNAHVSSPRPA